MREIRQSGSAGGEVQINEPSLPLSMGCQTNLVSTGAKPAGTKSSNLLDDHLHAECLLPNII